ncbi:MAG: hypothetical protein IKB95_09285, partial [Bacteroidales bacterium]|nr:hypothetical protein [Bacteroidales bacterium]
VIILDFIRECEVNLYHLNSRLVRLLDVPLGSRDLNAIRITEEMISDIEFAMVEYKRCHSCKRGYRPRRKTLLNRPDFYQGFKLV